jgi:hypothetical protein
MVDEINEEGENFLLVEGPNDVVHGPWSSVPSLRPLFDDFIRQEVGTMLAIPQKIIDRVLTSDYLTPIYPFELLVGTTRYQRTLNPYKAVRSTIVLRVVLRAAVTCYGVGVVSWHHGVNRMPTTATLEGHQIVSSAHCQVVDLASSPETILRIPYVHAMEYLPKTYTQYATVYIYQYALRSIDTSITPQVNMEVWAHLEDVDVTDYIEAQSQQVVVRPQEYNVPGRVSLPVAVAAAGVVANVGQQLVSRVLTEGYSEMKKSLFAEARKAAGSPEKLKEHVSPVQSTAENVQTPVFDAKWGNVNSLTPTTALQTMTEMSMSRIDPALYGDVEYHTLEDLVQNAVYFDQYSFTNPGDIATLALGPEALQGYAGYVSRHFRFVRCRPRIGLWFSFSPLMSARFQVRFYKPATLATTHADSSIPQTTLLVKGSSFHLLEIPYNFDSPMIETYNLHWTVDVRLMNKSEPTTAGNTPIVDMIAFTSMGPGAQFFSVCHPRITEVQPAPPLDEIEAQSSLRELNRSEPTIGFTRSPLAQISYVDNVETVEELASRWTTLLSRDKNVDNTPLPPLVSPADFRKYGSNAVYGDNAQHFIPLYALWRGSKDVRYIPDSAITANEYSTMASTSFATYYSDTSIANGGYIATANTPLQFRIPFITPYRALLGSFASTIDLIHPFPRNTQNLATETYVISRASPDFQVFCLNALYQGYMADDFQPL